MADNQSTKRGRVQPRKYPCVEKMDAAPEETA